MAANNAPADPGDRLFIHYSKKQQLIAWISRTFFDNVTYTVKHGKLAGFKRRGGLGWLPGFVTDAEPTPEELFWRDIQLKDQVVYDIGAFHGLLTLLFSRRAAKVVSFEPNGKNRQRLEDNLRLNDIHNVTVRGVALAAQSGQAHMLWDAAAPGGARVVAGERPGESISLRTLDEEVTAGLPKPDFIKIDVEGFEQQVLEGGRETLMGHHPGLFIEIHGNTMNEKRANVERVVELLLGYGYERIMHIETGTRIDSSNAAIAARGHLYCPRQER